MKVAIRVDASSMMGSGHLMRCLTLANALRARGDAVTFVSRAHRGNMIEFLRAQGQQLVMLPEPPLSDLAGYAAWLGVSQRHDAEQTIAALHEQADLLVVDHYGIGAEWERAMRPCARAIMAIDDLADRAHDCDLLLDQNLVTHLSSRYGGLVPSDSVMLLGPQYGLVRPEFAEHRASSLARRQKPRLESLIIFMGGSDTEDDTARALDGALQSTIPWERIDVVVGLGYGGRARLADHSSVVLHVQTPFMARLMAEADVAITAGGSISWEKCVLGLPSLVAVQADNQAPIAAALGEAGAQINLGRSNGLAAGDYAAALQNLSPISLHALSNAASMICDGSGVERALVAISSILQS